jgi:hypothetical protein
MRCSIIGLHSNAWTKACNHSPRLVCTIRVFGHWVMFGGGHVYPSITTKNMINFCPYKLYVFQIEKCMSHELGFGHGVGTHP